MIIDRYKYFLFDIDRTLWDFDSNASVALEASLKKFPLPIDDYALFVERYESFNKKLWDDYEAGKISKEFLRTERFYKTLKIYYGIDDIDLAKSIGHEYLEEMALGKKLIEGAETVLNAIKVSGGRMAIVSNGFREVQYRKLASSGIKDCFETVIISDEVGVNKPHPQIFALAMDGIGGNKKETLMVGDDFANDIEGAQIYGIDQFYYNPHHKECDGCPTYESDSLLTLIR